MWEKDGGTQKEESGGWAGSVELRTKQLLVVNWNLVASTLKPPWSQSRVPNPAPVFS